VTTAQRLLDPAVWGESVLASYAALATEGPKPTARGGAWAIAAEHPYASLTGQKVLEAGGTAADAFVAVAAVKHVVMPGTTSLGGVFGGVYYHAPSGEVIAINAGLSVPRAETLGESEQWDHLTMKGTGRAVLVPGVVRGLEDLHRRFGKLPWDALWTPAIHFARVGFPMYDMYWRNLFRRKDVLGSRPGGREAYFPSGEMPPEEGPFRQLVLADTLERIAAEGADHCYTGAWARDLVAAVEEAGGRMTMEDLEAYETRWDAPVSASYLGYDLVTAPPPHFGGVGTLLGLQVLEELGSHQAPPPWTSGRTLLQHIQVFKAVLNPPGVAVDLRRATDEQRQAFRYAYSRAAAVQLAERIRVEGVLDPTGSAGTHSHNIVVADTDGSLFTSTYTIHSDSWGDSGIVVGGISLNSTGFQYALQPITPGERICEPLSAYIAFKDGKPRLAATVIGSGLVGCQLQNTENVLGRQMTLQDSVSKPRYGYFEMDLAAMQQTERVQIEPFDASLLDEVEAAGQPLKRASYRWEGHAHADTGYWAGIAIDEDGRYEAVVDPRLPGLSLAG
jgi:gamma-glutamyltranspeptidase/glutathione hydrolase